MAAAVGHGPTSSPRDVPGEAVRTMTSLLEKGTGMLQNFAPPKQIHQHLCAFHFYAYDLTRQVEAHHFCGHYNEDVHQCAIYDSPEENARLIGIEYIVSENVFLKLPDAEKPLWHSHEYEVQSGVLFAPWIPETLEKVPMSEICKTYGKVFHFWQYDRGDTLPLGLPQLMMALTDDGQLHPKLAEDVETRFAVSFEEKRRNRADLKGPDHGIHPLANLWKSGKGLASVLRECDANLPSKLQEISKGAVSGL
ncbi:hypothetical protein O6H91_10G108200 [Diphasiastrum complanatum]|uniref:Uncharacterized protein n=1 Tax=Diphasiastrum complanatum TaxID=34168 RepID=A0ACC2CKF6_DIPCM|nr:hypothetical protein O6H91_Y393200 [Diphasiastrum complanatum]KAJ7542476.1 hypothetical protein O6H91_10G108200 [Diphasiastrum complanatum]